MKRNKVKIKKHFITKNKNEQLKRPFEIKIVS